MEEGEKRDDSDSRSHYQILHELYQSLKGLSKTIEQEEKEGKNVSSTRDEAKRETGEIIDRISEKIDETTRPEGIRDHRLIAMKITMLYERSKLLSSLGDENLSRETLKIALDTIMHIASEAEVIFLAFRVINHYAYLLTKKADYETAREVLEFAEKIYRDAKKRLQPDGVLKFFTSDDLFVGADVAVASSENSNKLERLVTNNLQMLSFVCNKQEMHDKFAEYHHEVLRRQLEMEDEDATMWAIKAAKLASYFLSKNRFVEARHHLSAAIYVLQEYEKEIQATKLTTIEKLEDLNRKFADVAKCWVKYGLFLFSVSKTSMVAQFCFEPNRALLENRFWEIPLRNLDHGIINCSTSTRASDTAEGSTYQMAPSGKRINTSFCEVHRARCDLATVDDVPEPVTGEARDSSATGVPDEPRRAERENSPIDRSATNSHERILSFPSLRNKLVECENAVVANIVETTAQARALFLHTHGWLKKVKMYYSLGEYPMEYVNAILDLSELYRYLAFYEEDIESQYAAQKLRADALETLSTVLREIRPQCYMAVSVELLRELAEVQLEMMGLNLRRIYAAREADGPTDSSDTILRKMDALEDMHTRLEQFRDNFGHRIDVIERDQCRQGVNEMENLGSLFA